MSLACPAFVAALSPDLCRAVDVYCERVSATPDAEPLNALTNLAFVVAAVAAWRLLRAADHRDRLAVLLIALTLAIAVGSFLFHTLAVAWSGLADVFPIFAFMLVYLWLALTRFLQWSRLAALGGLAAYIAAGVVLSALLRQRPLAGAAFYLPALAAMALVGLALQRRRHPAGPTIFAAAGVFLVSLTTRTLDMPACAAIPIGTHFVWHILNAGLLYLLMRAAIRNGAAGAVTSRAAAAIPPAIPPRPSA